MIMENRNMVKKQNCYMDTDTFIICIKTWYLEHIADHVETRFDTANYELDRPLSKWKTNKVIGLMKDELGRKSWQNLLD